MVVSQTAMAMAMAAPTTGNITSNHEIVGKARRPGILNTSADRIAICIIARNEAAVIGRLIGDLAAQSIFDAGRSVDLLVVSNGSHDGTARSEEHTYELQSTMSISS